MMGKMRVRFPTGPPRAGQVLFVLAILVVTAEVGALVIRNSQLSVNAVTATSSIPPPTTASIAPPTRSSIPPPKTPSSPTAAPSTRAAPSPTPATIPRVDPPVKAPGSFTYTLPASTLLTVTASAFCWVQARTAARGKILSTQTLVPGQSESFPAPLWLRFGCPTSLTVTAGTTSLELPTPGPGNLVVLSP